MPTVATSTKETLRNLAGKDNVETRYAGREKTMYLNGDEARVKAFLRKMNLKGKAYFTFALKQGAVTTA